MKEQFQSDLKGALLNRDANKASVLRMVLAAIKNEELRIEKALSKDEIIKIIKTEVRKIKDSIEQFSSAGRDDLAAKEEAALKILQAYLPEEVSEEEIRKEVQCAIDHVSATGMKDIGRIMGVVMQHFGNYADGATVNRIVKEELSKL